MHCLEKKTFCYPQVTPSCVGDNRVVAPLRTNHPRTTPLCAARSLLGPYREQCVVKTEVKDLS